MQFRGSVFHTLIYFLNGNIMLSSLHKVNLEAHFVAVWLKFADRMAVFFLSLFIERKWDWRVWMCLAALNSTCE